MEDEEKTRGELIKELRELRIRLEKLEAQNTVDPSRQKHQQYVARLACAIATEMYCCEKSLDALSLAGLLMDFGMLYIPYDILCTSGLLGKDEYTIVKSHPYIGYELLKHAGFKANIAEIIYQHHERMDGSGYPRGLSGDDILPEARILAVADTVVSMTFSRPHRDALNLEEALEEIALHRHILYDDEVVDACLHLFREKGYTLNPA